MLLIGKLKTTSMFHETRIVAYDSDHDSNLRAMVWTLCISLQNVVIYFVVLL